MRLKDLTRFFSPNRSTEPLPASRPGSSASESAPLLPRETQTPPGSPRPRGAVPPAKLQAMPRKQRLLAQQMVLLGKSPDAIEGKAHAHGYKSPLYRDENGILEPGAELRRSRNPADWMRAMDRHEEKIGNVGGNPLLNTARVALAVPASIAKAIEKVVELQQPKAARELFTADFERASAAESATRPARQEHHLISQRFQQAGAIWSPASTPYEHMPDPFLFPERYPNLQRVGAASATRFVFGARPVEVPDATIEPEWAGPNATAREAYVTALRERRAGEAAGS